MKVTILHQGDRFNRDVVCDGPAAEDLESLLDAEREIDGHAFGAWVARWMRGMLICDRPATMLEMALYLEWADGEKRRRMEEEGCCQDNGPLTAFGCPNKLDCSVIRLTKRMLAKTGG